MLGLGDDKKLVGAKEKRQRAEMLKHGMTLDQIKSKREGKQNDSPAASVLLIYFIACAVMYFLLEGPWKNGVRIKTGHGGFDDMMFSAGALSVFGDPTIDFGLTIAIRGFFLFLAAGILPGLSYLWIRGLDKTDMNPFRTVWGVTVGIILVYFICAEFLFPALGDIFGMIS